MKVSRPFFTVPDAHYVHGYELKLSWLEQISLFKLEKAKKLPWHSHQQMELIFCLKGLLYYELGEKSRLTLPPGCFCIIPADQEHRVLNGVDGPCIRLSFFLNEIPPSKKHLGVFSSQEYKQLIHLANSFSGQVFAFSKEAQLVLARIEKLALNIQTPASLVELRIMVSFAFHSALTNSKPGKSIGRIPLMDEAIKWMEEHYQDPNLSLQSLILYMGYGHSRFSQLFKKHTGRTPIDWLIIYRISKGCELLTQTDKSINQIAKSVGFSDVGFFSRTFLQRIGESPSRYRKTHRPK